MLLVTGGFYTDYLDSTEIFQTNAQTWSLIASAKLPSARKGFSAATLNNTVYIFGKSNSDFSVCNENNFKKLV